MDDSNIQIIEEYQNGEITVRDVCERLGVHRVTLWRRLRNQERKTVRLRRHGLAGRRSNRSKSESFKKQLCELYAHSYKPLGHTAFSFYDAVARSLPDYVCYSTVLKWLREAGQGGSPAGPQHPISRQP